MPVYLLEAANNCDQVGWPAAAIVIAAIAAVVAFVYLTYRK